MIARASLPTGYSDVETGVAGFRGLRMAADEFLQIPDDGCNYELVDGVVVMSPSPTPRHQAVTTELVAQISWHLRQHSTGRVFAELDVHLGKGPTGGDLVYKPEVVYLSHSRLTGMQEKLSGAPDLVVEIISRGSRRMDSETKRRDYERFGAREFWLIDPTRETMTFYRLERGAFVEVTPQGDRFLSEAIPGFALDLKAVRECFKPW